MKPCLTIFLAATAISSPLAAAESPPFSIAGTNQAFWRLDEAVKAAGDGQVTILIAPGTFKDCAIVTAGDVTFKAAALGTAILDGATCEGKAALVLRGRSAKIDGIIFQNMRVADRNGSGIRLEHGDLTVVNSMFRNSEQGILTADDPQGQITIDRTTFSGLGGCPDGMCSHSLYVGGYGKLTVTRTRFERGTGGHYVKSRAAIAEISDNSFDDTQGRETNYMIDLPAGAVGAITRNTFVQGKNKENHSAFVAVGAEARNNRSVGLIITDNDASMAVGVTWPSIFVADWTHEPLKVSANRLGKGLTSFEQR